MKRIDPVTVQLAGWAGDLWGRLTGREPDLNSAAVEMSRKPHHFSYARAKEELGYSPRPASEAMRAAYEWFIEHGYLPMRKNRKNR